MAITNNPARQPYLDNLELPARDLSAKEMLLPAQADIDPDAVEYFVDVDLDELNVFFWDKSRPYSIDAVSDAYSLMIDDESSQVIGVSVNRFLSEAIKRNPELLPILRHSTMIAGESLEAPDNAPGASVSGIKARVLDWVSERVRIEERRTVFANFAELIGLH